MKLATDFDWAVNVQSRRPDREGERQLSVRGLDKGMAGAAAGGDGTAPPNARPYRIAGGVGVADAPLELSCPSHEDIGKSVILSGYSQERRTG